MDAKSIREQTIKDAKSNLILDAARKVFAEKGFHETRLEDIGAESGFSKASLYNYYADKEEIFLSLAAREFHLILNKLVSVVDADAPFFNNLERIIRTTVEHFGENLAFIVSLTNFQMLPHHNPEKLIEHHREISNEFYSRFSEITALQTKLIERAQQQGEVTSALPAGSISWYIGSLIRGICLEWKLQGKMGDVRDEADRLLAFIRFGITPPDQRNT